VIRRASLAVEVQPLCGRLMFAASFSVGDRTIPLLHSRRRRGNQQQDLGKVARGRACPGLYQSLFSSDRRARRSRFGSIFNSYDASAMLVDHTPNNILATALKAFIHAQKTVSHEPAAREAARADLRLPKTQGPRRECRYAPPRGSQVDAWQP
jgi:hypothetical protein